MAGKCSTFWQGLEGNMAAHPAKIFRTIDIRQVIEALAHWREGMEQGSPDLSGVTLAAPFVLFDVCNLLGLTEEERVEVMGAALARAVEDELDAPIVG
jgi:hypothetical protein